MRIFQFLLLFLRGASSASAWHILWTECVSVFVLKELFCKFLIKAKVSTGMLGIWPRPAAMSWEPTSCHFWLFANCCSLFYLVCQKLIDKLENFRLADRLVHRLLTGKLLWQKCITGCKRM